MGIQEFNKAAAVFRSVFSGALRGLRQEYAINCEDILARIIEEQEIAMIQFKPYLPDGEQEKLDVAWKEYVGSDKNNPDRINLNIYGCHKIVNKKEYKSVDEKNQETKRVDERLRNDAILRIEKLLDIAKPR